MLLKADDEQRAEMGWALVEDIEPFFILICEDDLIIFFAGHA